MFDEKYWSQVNRARRNVQCVSAYPKEIPLGVAKLPNLGPVVEKLEIEPELPYFPVNKPVKALPPSPKRSKRQLRVGTRGFVSDAEWRFRHWSDRVLDETRTGCEYCQSRKNLTAVPLPGVSPADATMETLCVICPSCIQDYASELCCEPA